VLQCPRIVVEIWKGVKTLSYDLIEEVPQTSYQEKSVYFVQDRTCEYRWLVCSTLEKLKHG